MGIMTMGNLGKAIVKVRHSYFFSLYLIFSYFLKIIAGTMFKFSGISRYNYNLSPSIKTMKLRQLVHFSKC